MTREVEGENLSRVAKRNVGQRVPKSCAVVAEAKRGGGHG